MLTVDYLRVGSCCHPEWVTLQGGGWRAVDFPALAVLIHHQTRGYFLFDTGYSARFNQVTQGFPECVYRWITPVQWSKNDDIVHQLAHRNLAPEQISGIFISHFHADHVAALSDFPRAAYWALADSYAGLGDLGAFAALRRGFLPSLLPHDFAQRYQTIESWAAAVALPDKMRPFAMGWDVFGDGSAYAVALPGHARGQMGLWLNGVDVGGDVFLVADACWSSRAYQELRAPSWLSFVVHDSRVAYLRTLNHIHQLSQHNPSVVIMPSHCQTIVSRYTGATRG
ncbi:MAG: MBL fold metallo-hydrolase [Formosimonas sp.]